jgi:hypothetical protein
MKVRLNCWRGEDGPGDIVEIPDADAAALLHHGGAHRVDDDKPAPTGRVVKGSATLASASQTTGT